MLFRFTKKAQGPHGCTIVEDDGRVCRDLPAPTCRPNVLPRELVEALCERELGRDEHEVAELASLLVEELSHLGVSPSTLRAALAQRCERDGVCVPQLSAGQLEELRRLRDAYAHEWRRLHPEDTLEIEVTVTTARS
jgi:hypothetical protein